MSLPLYGRTTRTYDEHQAAAVEVSWRCCRRTVFATNPAMGCLRCR